MTVVEAREEGLRVWRFRCQVRVQGRMMNAGAEREAARVRRVVEVQPEQAPPPPDPRARQEV